MSNIATIHKIEYRLRGKLDFHNLPFRAGSAGYSSSDTKTEAGRLVEHSLDFIVSGISDQINVLMIRLSFVDTFRFTDVNGLTVEMGANELPITVNNEMVLAAEAGGQRGYRISVSWQSTLRSLLPKSRKLGIIYQGEPFTFRGCVEFADGDPITSLSAARVFVELGTREMPALFKATSILSPTNPLKIYIEDDHHYNFTLLADQAMKLPIGELLMTVTIKDKATLSELYTNCWAVEIRNRLSN